MKNVLQFFLFFLLLFLSSTILVAAPPIIATGSGNWSSTTADAPWPFGVVPLATDNVVIDGGFTVTIDQDVTVADLTIGT